MVGYKSLRDTMFLNFKYTLKITPIRVKNARIKAWITFGKKLMLTCLVNKTFAIQN
jgi:hypothetical protein